MALSLPRWFKLASTGIAAFAVATLPSQVFSQPNPEIVAVPQIDIFQGIVLGMVQGLTEFLPISSTAHLKVVPVVLGWGDPGVAYTAVIQLGSIGAVLWYFWSDLKQITTGIFKAIATKNYSSYDFRLGLGIILGSIPIIFFGLLIKFLIPDFDNSPMRSLQVIAFTSIGLSLLLGLAEQVGRRKRGLDSLKLQDSIVVGLAQALALIPGVSRSGSTLTAALFTGLDRAPAARFSFLLGIPAITLAGLVELKGAIEIGLGNTGVLPLIAGIISAAVFSYAAIAWLLRFLQTHNTWVFVVYRLAFGIAILTAISTGLLQNT
ncbi:undecaprenyl-diphosphate phosphatase [Chroogloeocystis siderophila]|jgi:undecaprenyl-diphosphatase|uniref:Undecaprenyl-diphosphatase n=1 Tax=Chroogloeocystis siderophila 5.2 s.c.1 TaxID=247279 RepID=A0A1U7HD82_9CHRO|nr:undecaprenyl-diphosphate phosphatase [Chroogloeocystis siderophila]OKH21498.1 undecaprenyl-diphosphatase [Chroogloeocystis siderophila 5.2 s.c.1]